jgi:hypothetical protein
VPFPAQLQISLAVAVVVFLLVLAAEKLHDGRCRTVARLATGPSGRPRRWVSAVPITKAAALAGMAWALTILYYEAGGVYSPHQPAEERREHLADYPEKSVTAFICTDGGRDGRGRLPPDDPHDDPRALLALANDGHATGRRHPSHAAGN